MAATYGPTGQSIWGHLFYLVIGDRVVEPLELGILDVVAYGLLQANRYGTASKIQVTLSGDLWGVFINIWVPGLPRIRHTVCVNWEDWPVNIDSPGTSTASVP